MAIGNSKIRKLLAVPQLLRGGFVVQTWSWMSSLISDAKYRAYGPKRMRFTPKGDKARLDWAKWPWSIQGRISFQVSKITDSNENQNFEYSDIQKLSSFPTPPDGVCRPEIFLGAISNK